MPPSASPQDAAVLTETASVQPAPTWPYAADYTPAEFWSWQPPGGVDTSLHAPWWSVATLGGSRSGLPALRGQDSEMPFRSGKQTRAKMPDSRVITMIMWNAGVDQLTGRPAADQGLAWNNNWQTIKDMFWTPGVSGSRQGKLTRRWRLGPQGSGQLVSATAMAEIAGTIDPAMTGRTRNDFSVDLLLADPFFYGPPQQQVIYVGQSAQVYNLGDDVVGWGYAQPFTVVLTGPLTTPTLTNTTWGVSFTVNQTLASGFTLTLDVLNFTATGSDSNPYGGNVVHSGSRPWMVLGEDANVLALTSASSSDTGSARLTWSPPYV